jgi:hypothetical protein
MRGLSTSSTRPNALSPYLYGRYSPPKQRWRPLFACLGAGGDFRACAATAATRRSPVNGKPVVYTVIGSNALVTMRPAVEERAHAGAVADKPADVPTLARPETAIDTAEAASPRGKVYSGHSSKRRASGHRYAARKSHHREVLGYGRNGTYPRARYGFNGGRYGGWFFN